MMKKYIAPEFKVAMFHKEAISADEMVANVSLLGLQGNTADFVNGTDKANRVRRSIDFNNAIKFN